MPRLTEVQRGKAIALLMQGQRQPQVSLQFGVNVSTIERPVRRLRDTGRVADHPRVTTPRQDRAIRLVHLRNRHVTATETASTTVGNHNRHIHPKTVRNRLREFGLRARRPYIGFTLTRARHAHRIAMIGGTWSQTISNEAMEMGLFHRRVFFVRTVDVVYTDVVGNASPTLAFLRGIGLGVARLWSGEGYLTG
jgi:transposase